MSTGAQAWECSSGVSATSSPHLLSGAPPSAGFPGATYSHSVFSLPQDAAPAAADILPVQCYRPVSSPSFCSHMNCPVLLTFPPLSSRDTEAVLDRPLPPHTSISIQPRHRLPLGSKPWPGRRRLLLLGSGGTLGLAVAGTRFHMSELVNSNQTSPLV